MKTYPAMDAVVGTSHAVNTKVELRAPDNTVVGLLPVEAGTVTADATRRVDRWDGDLTLAGLDWAPQSASDPLSGLSGHYVSIQRSATNYGQPETWVELARLWVYASEVTLSRRGGQHRVILTGPGALTERSVHIRNTANPGETAQQLIQRLLLRELPYTPTVLDTSTPYTMPTGFVQTDIDDLSAADQVAQTANIRVFFDALGRLVMRDPLPTLDVATMAAGRQLGIRLDVTDYTLTMGRVRFSNDVKANYRWTDANNDQQTITGIASTRSGPLRLGGPAGFLSTVVDIDAQTTQTQANAYATSVLRAMGQAWCTARIRAVQDPRLEPDDIVDVEYLDRTLRHRVVGVQFDLTTDAMDITARTALPTGA